VALAVSANQQFPLDFGFSDKPAEKVQRVALDELRTGDNKVLKP
jgi:hypothetical protein